jgi:hypothetical protein
MIHRAGKQLTRFKGLLDYVAGVIFIATPHFKTIDKDTPLRFSRLLGTELSQKSKQLFSSEDLLSISHTCMRFEEISTLMPILSCYETHPTKLKRPGLLKQMLKSEKVIVSVDSNLSQGARTKLCDCNVKIVGRSPTIIGCRYEKSVEVDMELRHLFQPTQSLLYGEILKFIVEILAYVPARIKEQQQQERNFSLSFPHRSYSRLIIFRALEAWSSI